MNLLTYRMLSYTVCVYCGLKKKKKAPVSIKSPWLPSCCPHCFFNIYRWITLLRFLAMLFCFSAKQQKKILKYQVNSAMSWIFLCVIKANHKLKLFALKLSLLFHSNHPDRHNGLWEASLSLNSQDLQSSLGNDGLHDVQVAANAAIDGVQLAALPSHIILDYDNTIWTQTLFAAKQEVHQVLVC